MAKTRPCVQFSAPHLSPKLRHFASDFKKQSTLKLRGPRPIRIVAIISERRRPFRNHGFKRFSIFGAHIWAWWAIRALSLKGLGPQKPHCGSLTTPIPIAISKLSSFSKK